MFSHYLTLTYRNMKRHKSSFITNLMGLAIGLVCAILIWLWVQNELSYDDFHKNNDHIYRVTSEIRGIRGVLCSYPLGTVIKTEIPGIKHLVRIRPNFGEITLCEVGERRFDENSILYADSNFFDLFNFPLLEGSPKNALGRPDGLILTRRVSRKYFGTDSPMGKVVRINGKDDLTVVGVLKDIPENSHLQFDFLLPMAYRARTDRNIIDNLWDHFNFYTYVALDDSPSVETSVAMVENAINTTFRRNSTSFDADFDLQPMTRIHLYSNYADDVAGQGSIQYVRVFSMVASFILLVACMNFMNLATARSLRRAKEVGLRKAVGAGRSALVYQFFGESLVITFLAWVCALVLIVALLPAFNAVTGKTFTLTAINPRISMGLCGIFFITSLMSGAYPAVVLSSFKPARVLRGAAERMTTNGNVFRNALVVIQFVVSISLTVCTLVIYDQLTMIEDKNLGYDEENLLYIPLKGDLARNIDVLKAELDNRVDLNAYSTVSELPVDLQTATIGVIWNGKPDDVWERFSVMDVNDKAFSIFKLKMLSGRSFSKDITTDSSNYIINQSALETMGLQPDAAIGQPLSVLGKGGTIVGVVEDFNFKTLRQEVGPIILRIAPRYNYMVFRTESARAPDVVAQLRNIWQKLNSSYHFEYGYVDQDLARLYLEERRMATLFRVFAVLTIFISCLGLSGLVAFTSKQRTKEIGIRKVLGASFSEILRVLSKDFILMICVAFVIAAPLAWYSMDKWLHGYAYRVDLKWWFFGMSGVFSLVVSLFTIGFQILKTVLMSPVTSLRND